MNIKAFIPISVFIALVVLLLINLDQSKITQPQL